MEKLLKYKKSVICLVILGGLMIGSPILAALLVDWPASPPPFSRQIDETTELHQFIAYIYEWAVSLGGLAVFIVLIIAGVQYLTSVGDPVRTKAARDRIRSGVIGLILLLSIFVK